MNNIINSLLFAIFAIVYFSGLLHYLADLITVYLV